MVTQQKNVAQTLKADVLLVTVTEVEKQAVLKVFAQQTTPVERHHIDENVYYDLGVIGDAKTFMVQSSMGAGGPNGATLVIYDGIKALSPSVVMMVGIAFGLRPEKQKLGDILISQQLIGYELQKIEPGANGEEVIKPRGDRAHPSPRLLNHLKASLVDWQGPTVHFGPVLSGEKLAKHKNFRNRLLGIEPEAIGGEMEGTGLYSAAHRNRVDWILIKAICDWADENKDDAYQQLAAENAAQFLFTMLQRQAGGGNNGRKPPFSPPPNEPPPPPARGRSLGDIYRIYTDHASWVLGVGWEPEGERIASSGGDGVVRIWNADTGHTTLTYHGHRWLSQKVNWLPKIYAMAWSPEGLRVASSGDGKKVYVWDATTGQTIREYEGHTGVLSNVFALAWSPGGRFIASGCSAAGLDKSIHVWDASTGETKFRAISSRGLYPNFSVSCIAWSPDGQRIAADCGNKTIQVWDATTGKLITTLKTTSDWIYTIAWSPDGRFLALANGNSTAEILNATNGEVLLTYRLHSDNVRDIAWSPDGSRLATASNDTTVQVWDATSGERLYLHQEHASWTTSVAWSPDGTRIASASNDKTVQVWQAV